MCLDKVVIKCASKEDAISHLEEGDAVVFDRGAFQHWALCVSVQRSKHVYVTIIFGLSVPFTVCKIRQKTD